MEIRPMGIDGALCVLGSEISDAVNEKVYALKDAVEAADIAAVTECVPGYATLLVRFDPMRMDYRRMTVLLNRLNGSAAAGSRREGHLAEIPVLYGGAYGPDLAEVAAHADLTQEEVIRIHCSAEYRIYMLGFLPGFPYLGGLDERLHTPRRATPRPLIPAGSVGIGGKQTGVYPMASPGGWQLIGRTPLRLFTPGRPLPYRPGDRIRFVPIDEATFRRMEAEQHER